MKGARRPPQLPGPVVSRRKRALSEEERELWDSVAKQTKPLRRKRVVKASLPVIDAPAVVEKPVPAAKLRRLSSVAPPVKPAVPAPAPLAPLGRRERSQLSRGKKDIDARLDLHGMTQTRAHHALQAFLHRCHHDGCTFVLVITGKGRTVGPESERGILRRQVPLWLGLPEFRGFVVGYEQAGIGHGGEGAIYVRIRRAR